ncbi:MAG: chaperonin [Bacteroidia bacterium]|nr:MAG: chaperonin [Bacteroidia bacterium]
MALVIDEKDFSKFIPVGDKVLIKPKSQHDKTKTGLYLPPGIHEKEKCLTGYIVKVGPGFPIPHIHEPDEAWKNKQVEYIPLQAQTGDLAVYMQKSGFEVFFNNEKYVIVPHSAILMLIRDEGLLK